jgi:hypothetical protein
MPSLNPLPEQIPDSALHVPEAYPHSSIQIYSKLIYHARETDTTYQLLSNINTNPYINIPIKSKTERKGENMDHLHEGPAFLLAWGLPPGRSEVNPGI